VTTITDHADAIQAGELVVLYLDECHLCHGDAQGYVWGPSDQRMEIAMVNERDRQTYFGAVEPLTGEVVVMEARSGDAEWTIRFLTFLRECYAGKQLLLCWDGASYHRGHVVREYLSVCNHDHPRAKWPITCIQFAPHAPEQNPIEPVWLQVKSFIRKQWQRFDGTFQTVKNLFEEAIMTLPVDFPKLHMYTSHIQLN
jgi:transposase